MNTTATFINDVTRLAMAPQTTTLGSGAADILRIADLEMGSRVVPLVLSINQEYGVITVDVPVVVGQQQYRMPDGAVANKLRDVRFVQNGIQLPLPKIEIEQLGTWTVGYNGFPTGFYLESGSINLVPAPSVAGALRIRYYTSHTGFSYWDGVATPLVGTVTAVSGYSTTVRQNDTITVTSESTFTNGQILGGNVNIIAARSPYDYLAIQGYLTSISPFSIAVDTANIRGPTPNMSPNVRIGDILVRGDLGGMPVIPLPEEAYPLLVTRTAIALLAQVGDLERINMLEAVYARQEKDFLKLFSPRVDGAPAKVQGVLQRNTFGWPNWNLR